MQNQKQELLDHESKSQSDLARQVLARAQDFTILLVRTDSTDNNNKKKRRQNALDIQNQPTQHTPSTGILAWQREAAEKSLSQARKQAAAKQAATEAAADLKVTTKVSPSLSFILLTIWVISALNLSSSSQSLRPSLLYHCLSLVWPPPHNQPAKVSSLQKFICLTLYWHFEAPMPTWTHA